MFLGITTLLIAFLISAVSAYYSILGLTAIFAAATVPVMIMGAALEAGKVMTAIWLHKNWKRAGWLCRLYLIPAIMFLMLLTSVGVFGFLSKAHLSQTAPVGDIQAQINLIDEKIQIQRENIEVSRKTLAQLNATVDETIARSKTERGAANADRMRKAQLKERAAIQDDIENFQKQILTLQEQRAPLAAQTRKVEAEVGPIKYVGALLYGDDADTNSLERAVRWMILLIVAVFDPLAIVLIIAGIKQLEWSKLDKQAVKSSVVATESKPIPSEPKPEVMNSEQLEDLMMSSNAYWIPPIWLQSNRHTAVESALEANSVTDIVETSNEITDLRDEINQKNVIIENYSLAYEQLNQDYQKLENQHTTVMERNLSMKDQIAQLQKQISELQEEENHHTQLYVAQTESLEEKIKTLLAENSQLSEAIQNGNSIEIKLQDFVPEHQSITTQTEANEEYTFLPPAEPLPSAVNLKTDIGTEFPPTPARGDMCMRVDFKPSRLFKWNGTKWIEINKNTTNVYNYSESYIRVISEKLASGEYSLEDLTESELEQVQIMAENENF